MKIIAIQGKENCGKSTVLKMLCVNFLKKVEEQNFSAEIKFERGLVRNIETVKRQIEIEKIARHNQEKTRVDNFIAVICLKDITVGISTWGDEEKQIDDAMEIFRQYSCEICFCAVHGKNSVTYKKLESYRNEKTDIAYIQKEKAVDYNQIDKFNEKFASELLDMLLREII